MSVFAAPANPPATDRQLQYLAALLHARFRSPSDVPEPLRCFIPHHGMTAAEASHAIDAIKEVPTLWKRRQANEQLAVASWSNWLAGESGDEAGLEQRWDDVLHHHFAIRRQVKGEHFTGKRLRIDRMLRPRGWVWGCGHDHEVGFEIKAGYCKTDVAQAADYANTRWQGAPDEFVIVGLHRGTRDAARPLADVGCFAFVVEQSWSLDGPALTLCWNGNRMWTGSLTSEDRDMPRLRWCPTRKFGSR